MDIGTRIKQLRTERRMSQETLAEALGVSRQAVGKWENGASLPSTANLLALCRLFDIPLTELTPEKQTDAPAHRRRNILSACTLAAGCVLLVLATVWAVSDNSLTSAYIGYADAETGILVAGPSLRPLLLCAVGAVLAAVSVFSLFRAKRKKRG